MRVWSGKGAAAQTYSALFRRWCPLFFLPRFVAPSREQAPRRYEVRLLQFAERLLVDRLVVVRHLTPLTQERHYRPIDKPHILRKVLTFGGARSIVQRVRARQHVLEPILVQQTCQLACQPFVIWSKEVPRLVERLKKYLIETRQGRTATLNDRIAFCDSDHPAWPGDALEFLQEFGPIPG